MKKYSLQAIATIGTATVLGLSEDQIRRRRHNLEDVNDGRDYGRLPEGYSLVRPIKPVMFKAGETVYADSLPKNLASEVGGAGESTKASNADSGSGSETTGSGKQYKPIDKMEKKDLHEFLTDHGVEFKKSWNNSKLRTLATEVGK